MSRACPCWGASPSTRPTSRRCWSWCGGCGRRYPGKDVWCYTGYLFEDLLAGKVGEHSRELLEQLDVLVDGPFVLEQKDLSLRFRGSANQRLIDVPASRKAGNVVWWNDGT